MTFTHGFCFNGLFDTWLCPEAAGVIVRDIGLLVAASETPFDRTQRYMLPLCSLNEVFAIVKNIPLAPGISAQVFPLSRLSCH